MNLVKLHKCGPEVSEICLGADHFGTKFDRDLAFELLDRFRDAGGNFVDTANIYARDFENGFSRSERILGEYLKSRGKASLVVATKGGHPNVKTMHTPRLSRVEIERDLDESLKSLGLDAIDLYYLHRDDQSKSIGEIIEILEEFVRKGKIRHYAASNYTKSRLEESIKFSESHNCQGFSAVSNMWSPAVENPGAPLSGDDTLVRFDDSDLELFEKSNLAFIPYSSTAKGWFAKRANGEVSEKLAKVFENENNLHLLENLKARGGSVQTALLEYICSIKLNSSPIIPITSVSNADQLSDLLSVHAE